MTRTLIIAATAAALAAPALANDQLARSLGVEPGVYSTAELSIMRGAAERNDDLTYRTIERRAEARQGGDILSTQSPAAAQGTAGLGKAQLAASLGVDPDDYTAAELARMFIGAHD